MDTSDLEHAQDLLLSHLQESLPGSLSASGALRWLVGQDVGEEVARAAMWDLIDTRRVRLTPDRKLVLPSRLPASATVS
jgi:hypothetical protein